LSCLILIYTGPQPFDTSALPATQGERWVGTGLRPHPRS